MKSVYLFFILTFVHVGFAQDMQQPTVAELNHLLDEWHIAAAQANFEGYFRSTSANFIFLGTAPGERWTKADFMAFSKPYFDRGKAWDFKPSNRNWQFAADQTVAYFDEDLETWMEGCRGAGIFILEEGEWKLSYYNLTVLIENEKMKSFIKLRKH